LLIEPESNIGVFDFSDVEFEIALGYYATMAQMDEIKSKIERTVSAEEMDQKRKAFQSKFPNRHVDEVKLMGNLSKKQKEYLYSTLGTSKKDSVYTLTDFKSQFLRLTQDEKIKYIQPIANYDSTRGYIIDLHVKREKDLTVYFGGNFSSRPVNIGYVGLKYTLFGRSSVSFFANSYFGKFYGSFLVQGKIDFGGKKRFSITPHVIFNRWDYFESFATFFELSRPSYIVQNERYGGVQLATPWGNNSVIKLDLDYGATEDLYYQTENFTAEDTADVTNFELITAAIGIDQNTLNRKQYASDGARLQVSFRGVNGYESTFYGTTSGDSAVGKVRQYWVEARVAYENYFGHWGNYTLGLQAEGLYSTKPFYENYTASLISSPAYQPIPESKTIFIDEFRTTQYAAGGLRNIFEIKKNLELRLEGYVFAPGKAIVRDQDNKAIFSEPFVQLYYIGSSALVYHSPLGPISLNLNYFDQQDEPWSFYFNFGFTIFNRSVYQL
jgi:NTE family protein